MRSWKRYRGIVCAAAAATGWIVACSTTPHFVDDTAGGSGGAASHTGSTATHGSGAGGAGSTTTTTTTTTTTSSSGSVGCVTVGDCGMIDTACAHPGCTAGQCVVTFEPMGTPTAAQVPGDCKQRVCDGDGHVTIVADDMDVPDDDNACTVDGCDGGAPVHSFAPSGASCGLVANMKCNAAGVCLDCTAGTQCGPGGLCFKWKCTSNRCVPDDTPAGQGNPGGGAPGDCQINACDGMGGVVSIPDPAGLPASPSACVVGACVDGGPSAEPAPSGTSCAGGHTCDGAGHCGSCTVDADCGPTNACGAPVCAGGQCSGTYAPAGPAPQQTGGDCQTTQCDGKGGLTQVIDNADPPMASDACHVGSCNNGIPTMQPVNVPTSDACNTYTCAPATGIVHTVQPDGTDCGNCSLCEAGTCTSQCSAGCACLGGTTCEC